MKQSVRVPGFTPTINGLKFINNWPAGTPDYTFDLFGVTLNVADASAGLCGGMVFTVMDLFNAGVLPPRDATPPVAGSPLFTYIVARLTHSFDPADVAHYLSNIQQPNGDIGAAGAPIRGIAWSQIKEEWPKIKADLDAGLLSPLGLVAGQEPLGVGFLTGLQDLGKCHQMCAWGYDLEEDDLTIFVYDPNNIDDTATIKLDIGSPTEATALDVSNNLPGTYRGFFRTNYEFHDPSTPTSAAYIITVVTSPGISNSGPLPQRAEFRSTWLNVGGEPVIRFTGDVHEWTSALTLDPADTGRKIDRLMLTIRTGADDLRGGDGAFDNCDVFLGLSSGVNLICPNINNGQNWGGGETKNVLLPVPLGLEAGDIVVLTIKTNFQGGISGDNWNLDHIELVATLKAGGGAPTPRPVIRDWVRKSGSPLIRFTGTTHVLTLPVVQNPADAGRPIRSLDLRITTGGDDLRGGDGAGDNCTLIVWSTGGTKLLTRSNVNRSHGWGGGETKSLSLKLPTGTTADQVDSLVLQTNFGGGLFGDNWNVDEVVLQATI